MNQPTTEPYAAMAGPPSETAGKMDMQRDWMPSETYLAQAGWSQWKHGAAFAGDAYRHQWGNAPLQPADDEQWATPAPGYQVEGPEATGAMWSPLSEGFYFQQQQQQYPQHHQQAAEYRVGNNYDAEDSWAPAMPPTPQLTPTWHHAQMLSVQVHHVPQAAEAQKKSMDLSPASGHREPQQARPQTCKNMGQKLLQPACTDTMATPPGESETDGVEPCTSGSKRQHTEDTEAAASVPGKKYRVKNRAAAKRCRDKSRQFEVDLAAKEKQLTVDHMFLEASAAALREEILTLKNQILQHGDCDCEVIQTYISKVACQVSNASACQQGLRR